MKIEKYIQKGLFALAIGLATSFQVNAQNLISNPSFEQACPIVCTSVVGGNIYAGCVPDWSLSHGSSAVFRNICPIISNDMAAHGVNYADVNNGGIFTEVNLTSCFPYSFSMQYKPGQSNSSTCSATSIVIAGANDLSNEITGTPPNIPHEVFQTIAIDPNASTSQIWQTISFNFEAGMNWKYIWIYANLDGSENCSTLGIIDDLHLEENCESDLGCTASFTSLKINKYKTRFLNNVSNGGTPGLGQMVLSWSFTNLNTGSTSFTQESNPYISTLPCATNDPHCDLLLAAGLYRVCLTVEYTMLLTGENCFAEYCENVEITGFSTDRSTSFKKSTETLQDPKSSFMVYPNPTQDQLEIRLPNGAQPGAYEIYNTTGQVVMSGTMLDKQSISTQELPAGTYILRVQSGEESYRKKISVVD